jgi:hypothetical protein
VETKGFDFVTKSRVISADIHTVHIIDDSDDLSDGEINFFYRVGRTGTDFPERDLGTGDTFDPGFHREFFDDATNEPMGAYVSGWDEDEAVFAPGHGLCLRAWIPGPYERTFPSVGEWGESTECWDDAGIAIHIPVVPARERDNETFATTVHLVTTGYALKFEADLTYSVSYQ